MTVSTTESRIGYNGNGATTVFAFPYRFLESSDLTVTLVRADTTQVVQTLNTDYTVTGADDDAGGTVTMAVAPASGERLVIRRVVEATQETDYISGDPFPAETHERALDKLTMLVQQNSEVANRTIVIPSYDPSGLNVELPGATSRANRLVGFDSLGNVIAALPVADSSTALRIDLADTTDPSKGAELVGFIADGDGTSPRTVRDKLSDVVSRDDYDNDTDFNVARAGRPNIDAAGNFDAPVNVSPPHHDQGGGGANQRHHCWGHAPPRVP